MKTLTETVREHRVGARAGIGHGGIMRCNCGEWKGTNSDHAEHVAAAYRDACTITTEADLAALPRYTLIEHRGVPMRHDNGCWWSLSTGILHDDDMVLPALVLWLPEDDS